MNLSERINNVLTHYESVMELAAEHEADAIDAAFHAEVAKIESMALGLVAQLKGKALNAAQSI